MPNTDSDMNPEGYFNSVFGTAKEPAKPQLNHGGSIGWVTVPDSQTESGTDLIRYDEFVGRLFKKDFPEMMLMHAALGVCGEAGELGDAIKKHAIYGKQLDLQNVIEELGDLRFYMQALMNELKISEQDVLQFNSVKLSQRYSGLQYSDEAAIARADKPEESGT